jgi:hypothetical protein
VRALVYHRAMKKTLVAAAGVAGLLGATTALAAWSGGAVTERLGQQTRQLANILPTFKVVEEQLERGLFSSTRTVTVQLGCLPTTMMAPLTNRVPGAPQPLLIRWRDRIQHGPFPGGRRLGFATIDTELLLPAQWQAKLEKVLAGQPLLRAHTEIGFDGKFVSQLKLAALKMDAVRHGSFESKPVDVRFSSNAGNSGPSAYALELSGVELRANLHGERFALKLGRLDSQGEVRLQDGLLRWLSPGKASGKLASLELDGSAPGTHGARSTPVHARFDAVQFGAESSLEKGLWSGTKRLSFKGKVDDVSIDKIEIRTSIKRVHAASYQKLLSSLLGTALRCEPSGRPTAQAAMFPDLQRDLGSLLLYDPEYSLDSLAIELDGKRAELSYAAGTRGVTADDLKREIPELLMSKGVLRASAKVQLGLIADVMRKIAASLPADTKASADAPGAADGAQATAFVNGMVDQFVASGYLVREGDFITVSSAIEAGQLVVNGKPMALPPLAPKTGP